MSPTRGSYQRVQTEDPEHHTTDSPGSNESPSQNLIANRLLSDTASISSRDEIFHNAEEGTSSNMLHEGSSSASNSAADRDLESQTSRLPPLRLSRKERVVNVMNYLFPVKQTYERLSNGVTTGRMQSNSPGRFVGQGTDGVFRNLMAKPDTEASRIGQEQHPPSYEEAAADQSPEYWEATMITPMYEDEVFVQGLPVGNMANFVWNILVTVAFQLVGFILCYLLHTSHAAKQGTRVGLGVTIIMYGYSIVPTNFGRPDRIPSKYEPQNPNAIDISKSSSIKTGGAVDKYLLGFVQKLDSSDAKSGLETPYLAYGLIAFGILIIAKAFIDFYNIKRDERRVLAPTAQPEVHSTTEAVDNMPSS